ncbi:peptidoglycan recognition family protein [Longispora sp. K20-0274]|uniref:peptidoglycan recognition protein family protein n=1 Tax=Longispora sp. K20-0274 TaxID=3088255 RepID=UPI00399A3C7C
MTDISRRALLKYTGTGLAVAASGLLVVGTASTAQAASAVAKPTILTRAQWGARAPKHPTTVLNRKPDRIVVHHTDTANTTDYSLAHAKSLSRSIQNHHMDTNGWDDVGQHFTNSRGGYLLEGRDKTLPSVAQHKLVQGAQVSGHNDHTIGIENEGHYTSVLPPAAQWNALVKLCAYLCDQYGLDPKVAIRGHRDFNATECPGDALYAKLPALRTAVAKVLG